MDLGAKPFIIHISLQNLQIGLFCMLTIAQAKANKVSFLNFFIYDTCSARALRKSLEPIFCLLEWGTSSLNVTIVHSCKDGCLQNQAATMFRAGSLVLLHCCFTKPKYTCLTPAWSWWQEEILNCFSHSFCLACMQWPVAFWSLLFPQDKAPP